MFKLAHLLFYSENSDQMRIVVKINVETWFQQIAFDFIGSTRRSSSTSSSRSSRSLGKLSEVRSVKFKVLFPT